jgi:hypothetical protein
MGSIAYWHHENALLSAISWQLPNTAHPLGNALAAAIDTHEYSLNHLQATMLKWRFPIKIPLETVE